MTGICKGLNNNKRQVPPHSVRRNDRVWCGR